MDSTPAIMARRHRAVAAYERLGSFKAAARELKGGTVKFVKRWVERYKVGVSLSDAPRPGRPTVGLERDEATELLRQAVLDRLGPSQMVQRLADTLGIRTSAETVRRFLKQFLGRPLRLKKKPRLTSTHKAARLAFAKKWVRKDWDNVVVTDSKYFWLCPRSVSPKVWVLYDAEPPIDTAERNCFKVHAYAGVSKWGRTKLFVTVGTTGFKADSKGVNGLVYKQLLQEQLIPACKDLMSMRGVSHATENWVFQQDNAKAHTSKVVKHWLGQQAFTVMDWPSKSPDLSWIENMWGYVSKQLSTRTNLTPENFLQAAMEEWDNIPNRVHMKMYESIKKRLRACIEANGGSVKY
jgi:transposase